MLEIELHKWCHSYYLISEPYLLSHRSQLSSLQTKSFLQLLFLECIMIFTILGIQANEDESFTLITLVLFGYTCIFV
jgi:hypothetical protein